MAQKYWDSGLGLELSIQKYWDLRLGLGMGQKSQSQSRVPKILGLGTWTGTFDPKFALKNIFMLPGKIITHYLTRKYALNIKREIYFKLG